MMRGMGIGLALGLVAAFALPTAASADGKYKRGAYKSGYSSGTKYRKGPAVRGYVLERRGGYSYERSDVINTYGDNRSLYGATNSYRDPMLNRQSSFGPFDSGFFFDSAISPRGGYAPYQN